VFVPRVVAHLLTVSCGNKQRGHPIRIYDCWPFLKEGANLSREPPGAAHDESGGGDVAPGLAPPTALGFRKRFMACLQVLNAFSVVRLPHPLLELSSSFWPLAWPVVVPACLLTHTIVHRTGLPLHTHSYTASSS
jgi:hypothetical protein